VRRQGLEPRTCGLRERPAIVRKRLAPCVAAGQKRLAIRPHPPNAVVGRRRGCHRGCHPCSRDATQSSQRDGRLVGRGQHGHKSCTVSLSTEYARWWRCRSLARDLNAVTDNRRLRLDDQVAAGECVPAVLFPGYGPPWSRPLQTAAAGTRRSDERVLGQRFRRYQDDGPRGGLARPD
jgi:hypothetical protein